MNAAVLILFACCANIVRARNPLIARIGMADPHMHVFKGIGNDRLFLVKSVDRPRLRVEFDQEYIKKKTV